MLSESTSVFSLSCVDWIKTKTAGIDSGLELMSDSISAMDASETKAKATICYCSS